ncbi:uncharacterized protein [Porites lutea]|uniref:uncharacterized protein n=1 Tax=Porites lutea TaxID=51062 RepID=UPI003CC51E19
MAKRPLYDFLPRNSEIHNFTSLKLTERQARVLGMGLKFRPSLLPPSEAQFDLQIQDFCRRVRLQDKFANCPPDKDFNPRLYVPTGWNPPRENPDLEDKLFALRKELLKNIVAGKPHWKNNLTKHEREELSELKSNPNIKILPTDKNLGPALVSTDWVQAETLRHLHDELSCHKVTQQDWYANRLNVINSREKLMTIYSRFISSSVARFLRSFDHFVSPAKFYVIPKIHKNPMVGRPIAASHSFITRPISTFVDELIKPKVHMPTVLRDSGELIQLLENTVLPDGDCFLVTADVVSLYPNVDTKKALIALDLLLREAGAPETPLLIQLARLVFENNYLSSEFCPDIFHQKFGIAMGTPFSVTVANAFMYHHEKDIVDHYSQYLILYKRFIDDIFAIWCGPKDTLLEFLGALNSKDQRIQLTHCISELSISFLDLFLYRDGSSSVLQFSTFQKPLNKYLYIPFESFHPSSNKKAFIKGELMRYARNSSSFKSFSETRDRFWKRLRLRGYPFAFLLPLFREIRYSDRKKWLLQKAKNRSQRATVFKTTFNCSHARIRNVINRIMPEIDCTVCYKATVTLANLCK